MQSTSWVRQIYGSVGHPDCDLCFMVAGEYELLANEIEHRYIYYWHLQKLHVHLEISLCYVFQSIVFLLKEFTCTLHFPCNILLIM